MPEKPLALLQLGDLVFEPYHEEWYTLLSQPPAEHIPDGQFVLLPVRDSKGDEHRVRFWGGARCYVIQDR